MPASEPYLRVGVVLSTAEDDKLIESFKDNLFNIQRQFRKAYPDRETRPADVQDILDMRPWTIDIAAVEKIHFARQDLIDRNVTAQQLLDGHKDYKELSEGKSAAHQFDTGDEPNRKFVSAKGGKQEIVLKKVGPGDDDWEIVTEESGPRDVGSYNFSGNLYGKHWPLDVAPWIRFGNTRNDPTTEYERAKSLVQKKKQPDPEPSKPAQDAQKKIEDGENNSSPLIFDLDGDGVEVIGLSDSSVYWDIDLDGFRELSAWVGADDGLLAIDLNGDGIITDHSELFGSSTTDGFAALAQYDTNQDSQITQHDAQFDDLLIWQDANSDGYTDEAELSSLADLDITQINLQASGANFFNEGQRVTHVSDYQITSNGMTTTRAIQDVWFNYDDFLTVFEPGYDFDPTVFFMPDIRGYGTLPDLGFALMLDSPVSASLRPLVTKLTDKSFEQLLGDPSWVQDQVRDIMFAWAGVDQIDPAARGPSIDARELHFLEAFSAEPFLQRGWSADPFYFAGQDLQEAFDILLDAMTARLLSQTLMAQIYADPPTYDINSDGFSEGGTQIKLSKIAEVTAIANGSSDPLAIWSGLLRLIEFSAGTDVLNAASTTALDTAIQSTVTGVTLAEAVASLGWDSGEGERSFGTNEDDRIRGTVGNDELYGEYGNDLIRGGIGADRIDGGAGNDLLIGGTGDDLIFGSFGQDVYFYQLGHGVDTYDDQGYEFDKIKLGAGILVEHVTFSRVSNGDLQINIDTGTQTGQIFIEDQFNYGAGDGHIEQIVFASGDKIRIDKLAYTLRGTDMDDVFYGVGRGGKLKDTIYGGNGDDTIYAYAPNGYEFNSNYLSGQSGHDRLYGSRGNDKLYGGQGNDILRGDSGNDLLVGGIGDDDIADFAGNDTYRFSRGHGHDTIYDSNGTADILQFGAGITVDDITVSRYLNSTLTLEIDEGLGGSIQVNSQFEYRGGIETFAFADGTVLDLTTTEFTTYGSAGDDRIYGVWYGGSAVDLIYAGDGDDTVYAYEANFYEYGENTVYGERGDDALYGSRGNDTLFGGLGNDVLRGDSGDDIFVGGRGDDDIYDFAGNDIYKFNRGHGTDTIYDSNGTQDTVQFGAGIVAADLTFSRYLNDTLVIDVDGGAGGSLRIDSQFVYRGGIEAFQFVDGSSLDLTTTEFTTFGSNGNDTLYGIRYGGSSVDTIYAGDGDDTVYAYAPNTYDYIENTVFGEAGNDRLYGSRGDDLLDGGTGDDSLYGAGGTDTFVYTTGHDVITDFAADILMLDDALWDGEAIETDEIMSFATVTNDGILFAFSDANSVLLQGLNDLTDVSGLIEVF